ncbi:nucleoside hydrolase [Acrocarpospora sp. B8E8]|uniref:nucleoside hydrolase n=1 Tax=Acrocarpospora sp. B8E8 TaxID=3153572 RepID=UPI00325D6163
MKRLLALLAVMLISTGCASPEQPPKARKIIIDTDMGNLNDDALATVLLAASGVEILGVTIVGGNTWPEDGLEFARRLLIAYPDIPVILGDTATPERRNGYSGAVEYRRTNPRRGPAADFIAEQVTKYPGEVTILTIGPATNLAKAAQTHPDMVPLVEHVVYLGGSTSGEQEFNWWFDPEAAQIAVNTPFPQKTVLSMDVGFPLPNTDVSPALGYFFARSPELPAWDAIAAAIVLDPAIATGRANVGVTVGSTGTMDLGPGTTSLVLAVDQERFRQTLHSVRD